MEKLMAVIVLLALALVCFGYAVGIIANVLEYQQWHIAFSSLAGFGCILTVCGICDAMTDD